MQTNPLVPVTVTIGDDHASFKQGLERRVTVAKVLGRELTEDTETVYLDRIVHSRSCTYGDWEARGAISTVLTRKIEKQPAGV